MLRGRETKIDFEAKGAKYGYGSIKRDKSLKIAIRRK